MRPLRARFWACTTAQCGTMSRREATKGTLGKSGLAALVKARGGAAAARRGSGGVSSRSVVAGSGGVSAAANGSGAGSAPRGARGGGGGPGRGVVATKRSNVIVLISDSEESDDADALRNNGHPQRPVAAGAVPPRPKRARISGGGASSGRTSAPTTSAQGSLTPRRSTAMANLGARAASRRTEQRQRQRELDDAPLPATPDDAASSASPAPPARVDSESATAGGMAAVAVDVLSRRRGGAHGRSDGAKENDAIVADMLSWDVISAVAERRKRGEDGRRGEAAGPSTSVYGLKLEKAPVKFSSHAEYLRIFRSLLLCEARSVVTDYVEESGDRVPRSADASILDTRSRVPFTFLVVDVAGGGGGRSGGGGAGASAGGGRGRGGDGLDLRANDIVLLSRDSDLLGRVARGERIGGAADSLADEPVALLGIATREVGRLEVCVLSSAWGAALKQIPSSESNSRVPFGKSWHVWRLDNGITSIREYAALLAAKRFKLLPSLLRGSTGKQEGGDLARTRLMYLHDEYRKYLRAKFNGPQLSAIEAAATDHGFTLIQGPPGTGKTTTLLGVLNTVHLSGFNRYNESLIAGEQLQEHREAGEEIANDATDDADPFGDGAGFSGGDASGNGAASGSDFVPDDPWGTEGDDWPSYADDGAGDAAGAGTAGAADASDAAQKTGESSNAADARSKDLQPIWRPSTPPKTDKDGSSTPREATPGSLQAIINDLRQLHSAAGAAGTGHSGAAMPSASAGIAGWLLHPGIPIHRSIDKYRQALALKPRILVAAPSNAAVDGIVMRLTRDGFVDGTRTRDGRPGMYRPAIVRVGKASREVEQLGVSLRGMSDAILSHDIAQLDEEVRKLDAEVRRLQHQIQALQRRYTLATDDDGIARGRTPNEILRDFAPELFHLLELHEKRRGQLTRVRFATQAVGRTTAAHGRPDHQARRAAEHAIQMSLLSDAQIVLTTLSSSALTVLEDWAEETGGGFETVVIDEAGQAVELSTLIPLRYGASSCVLVGDPAQLPATVTSREAVEHGFDRSLFARLLAAGVPNHMLTLQFRGHPDIFAFPSKHFYQGKLLNADAVTGGRRDAEFHRNRAFRPFVFFDVAGGASKERKSYRNPVESQAVISLLAALAAWRGTPRGPGAPPNVFSGSVGVISPYTGQVDLIKADMARAFPPGHPARRLVDRVVVSSVDGFQGQERDVMILSCVRASADERASSTARAAVGFLDDTRRMNVGLTRAKYSCWVIGHAPTLQNSEHWGALLAHARATGAMVRVDDPFSDPHTWA